MAKNKFRCVPWKPHFHSVHDAATELDFSLKNGLFYGTNEGFHCRGTKRERGLITGHKGRNGRTVKTDPTDGEGKHGEKMELNRKDSGVVSKLVPFGVLTPMCNVLDQYTCTFPGLVWTATRLLAAATTVAPSGNAEGKRIIELPL